jgi:transposase
LLSVVVHPADVQDRDGARQVLRTARRLFPFIDRIFADAGYQGPKMAKAVADTGCWTIEIVKRSDAHRFVVLPKRWIVERTFAWISRNRRLARDFERYARSVAAFIRLAMIRVMLRRLTKPTPCLLDRLLVLAHRESRRRPKLGLDRRNSADSIQPFAEP